MPQHKPERRFVSHEFRVSQESDKPQIAGYAALFDSASEDMGWIEMVDPHAFDKVMTSRPDVRALFNHDPNLILGRTVANTLKLTIDTRGLAYSIDPPDTQLARDLMVSMQRGDVSQSSYSYIVSRDQWTDNEDGSITRRILEISELFDVSPVTYPAFVSTTAGVRSLPDSCPVEYRSRLEHRYTDDDSACLCQCAQCQDGNCDLCSDPDCDDENCESCCQQQRSRPISAEQRQRMEMTLALAKAK